MATYKLEIKKEFGQFHHRLTAPTDPVPSSVFVGPTGDLRGLLATVEQSLEARGVSAADAVVFRHVAYGTRRDLRAAVRSAVY